MASIYSNPNFKKFHVENIESLYQNSIPNTKLYYPEPYIASPSFIHNDIWYMHILVYWYWLWFVFIFIIVFFFLTFLCCLRWCNPRINPRRETRGVSRSKCGDLITATIPVTWAISIIISESTDAMDYFDGFKTTELIVGIRAYQWGWEYYYPKDLDTNYAIKPSYSEFLGNSLRYSSESQLKLSSNKMNNFLKTSGKGKSNNLNLLLTVPSTDSFNIKYLNNTSANLEESFKHITRFKKNSNFSLYQGNTTENSINNVLLNSFKSTNLEINNFKILKNYNFLSYKSYLNTSNSLLDKKLFNKISSLEVSSKDFYKGPSKNFINSNLDLYKLSNSLRSDKLITRNLLLSLKKLIPNLKVVVNQNSYVEFLQNNNLSYVPHNNFTSNTSYSIVDKLNTFDKDYFFNNKNVLKSKSFSNEKTLNSSPFLKKHLNSGLLSKSNKSTSALNLQPVSSNNLYKSPQFSYFNNSKFGNSESNFLHETRNLELSTFWGSNFLFNNGVNKITQAANLNQFRSFSFVPNFFYYADYSFLNKDSYKYADQIVWDSYYSSYDSDFLSEPSNEFIKSVNNSEYLKDYSLLGSLGSYIKKLKVLSQGLVKTGSITSLPTNSFLLDSSNINIMSFESLNMSNYILKDLVGSSYNLKSNQFYFSMFNKTFLMSNSFKVKEYSQLFYINFYKLDPLNLSWVSNLGVKSLSNSNWSNTFVKSNNTNLRSSASELIADYKSLQKVYKLRFDDLRSHSSVSALSSSFTKQLDLSKPNPQFSSILRKNNSSYFTTKPFVFSKIVTASDSVFNKNQLNNYSFDLPFLVALQSDQSRYVWFDWFSRWSKYEVQQASLAKLGLYGLPKADNSVEYGAKNSNFSETEAYLSRLMMARKNYNVSSRFAPNTTRLFNKFLSKNSPLVIIPKNWLGNIDLLIIFKNNYSTVSLFNSTNMDSFSNKTSGINFKTRNIFKQFNNSNFYGTNYSKLSNILTKRDYMYRYILVSNNVAPNITSSLYKSEFWFKELKSSMASTPKFYSLTPSEDRKNQYTNTKRGVSSMIRQQASNMVSLPVELRIQVLASSRDIIHSWAIPSAGVKVDCVPGYSSHKILFFLLSGIYWGQCMEICGRYHHWMPIIVYFMKRDLFFLWCSHFVLSDKDTYINNYSQSNTFYKQKPIKFDISLSEAH